MFKHRTWWWNPSWTWGSPYSGSAAASSIPVARPGHDFDCAQAPVRLVACRTALIIVENGTQLAPPAATPGHGDVPTPSSLGRCMPVVGPIMMAGVCPGRTVAPGLVVALAHSVDCEQGAGPAQAGPLRLRAAWQVTRGSRADSAHTSAYASERAYASRTHACAQSLFLYTDPVQNGYSTCSMLYNTSVRLCAWWPRFNIF